jgi:hypothetical protein
MHANQQALLKGETANHSIDERDPDEGLYRIGTVFGGIIDDYKRRMPYYADDFKKGLTKKTISSSLFMFFATFASTVALGVVIKRNTKCPDDGSFDNCQPGSSYLGVTEYLVMNSVAGMAHALFGCQPLLVLRPTGPITAFVTLLFNVSKSFKIDFQLFLAWTGIFVGFYMMLIAAFEVSRHIKLLTRFLHEIFAFFVCSIYVVDGIMGMNGRFTDTESLNITKLRLDGADEMIDPASMDKSIAEAQFAFILTMILLVIAFKLHAMKSSRIGNDTINGYLVDYALTIALGIVIFVSYIPKMQVLILLLFPREPPLC